MQTRWLWLGLLLLGLVSPALAQNDPELQTLLGEYAQRDEPGVAVLLDDEEEVSTAAAGAADLASETPLQATDRFRIGSITKTFVAVVMLQLQNEGLLSLDDPMAQWLPADLISLIPYYDQITLRQLLNMTSGIYNYTETDYFDAVLANPSKAWTPQQAIAYIYDQEAYFPPGEGYYYSNTNYLLLHLVIEAATGQTLAEQLQTRIFDPLEMSDSYLETSDKVALGLVNGYSDVDFDGQLDDVTRMNDGLGLADGGIVSTLADMAVFGDTLLREQDLLSDSAWAEMTTWVDDGEGAFYGLGLSYYPADEDYPAFMGHGGATAGFLADLTYIPDWDVLVVSFTNNFDNADFGEVLFAVLEIIE
jgi:D-alanyl-D-alanine carboxypeptidase